LSTFFLIIVNNPKKCVTIIHNKKQRILVIESNSNNSRQSFKTALSEDEVLRQIEQAVIDHRLPPGTKLKEVQLAEVFGVKRGTIRKVLSRLAYSRLVDQLPNRGASVAKPSVKEGRDLFATRRALESTIIETLTPQVDKTQIQQLRLMLDQEQNAYEADDSKLALSLSVDFHRLLAKMSGNSVLEEYLNDIIRRTPLVILTHLSADPQNRCRNQEHEAIVDAIEAGNAKKATRIMNQHLLHIENRIEPKLEDPRPDLATLLLSS
jgi:DNA-binding GntR family transcriptional regulator